MGIRLPFWVLDYWTISYQILEEKRIWKQAVEWLQQRNQTLVIKALRGIPWGCELPREFVDGVAVSVLARLFSEDWLAWGTIDLMLAVMRDEIRQVGMEVAVVLNHFGQKLTSVYRYEQRNYATSKSCSHLRNVIDQLKKMTAAAVCLTFGICVSSRGVSLPVGDVSECNHWVAVIAK